MRHSTTSLACLLFLAGCGGAPDGADPSTPEPTGEISQGSFIVLLNSTDPRWSFQGQFQRDDCRNFWSDDFANDAWTLPDTHRHKPDRLAPADVRDPVAAFLA